MNDKRKTSRRNMWAEYTSTVNVGDKKQTVRVIDVSSGGMKILSPDFILHDTEVFCKIDIYPGVPPFYVKGNVVRAVKSGDDWEIGIRFDKVRVHNFLEIKKAPRT